MGDIDLEGLSRFQIEQGGLITRDQLWSLGARKPDLDRMHRRRELTDVHRGVFVNHTGPLTWRQRAWAAVLYAAPAALYLESADEPPPDDPITLALVHRAKTDLEVIRLLTTAVGSRRTTASRLRETLDETSRIARRPLVIALLDDLEAGTCSVLEHGYLTRVERAHGLPTGRRQRPRSGARGAECRDVEYEEVGLVVELDGRVGHLAWVAQGRDADRDLDDHADGREAVRLRWAQVFGTPCRTADRLGRILARRGWTGRPRSCGPGCEAA